MGKVRGRERIDRLPVSSADPIAMTPDWSTLLLLIPIGFLGSFVYGVTGFGSGLITVPLAAALVDLPFALAVFCLIDTLNVARVWLARPQSVDRDEARRLLPTCAIGVAAGIFLLTRLPLAGVMTAFGVFLLGYAIYGLALAHRLPAMPTRWAYLAGFTGGLTSAMFGAGGPPFAIYLSRRPLSKERIRSTLALTSVVSITARLIGFTAAGLFASPRVWIAAAMVTPATLVALAWADRLHDALPRERLIQAMHGLVCVAGLAMIARSLLLSASR